MEKTPLSEIFRGQLRTRTVKNGENEPTENIEPFFTLKLDIEVLSYYFNIYFKTQLNFLFIISRKQNLYGKLWICLSLKILLKD